MHLAGGGQGQGTPLCVGSGDQVQGESQHCRNKNNASLHAP
jgi:hypothetical protein